MENLANTIEAKSTASIQEKVMDLANYYLRLAENEYRKFCDDSYDSDIAAGYLSADMELARQRYYEYLTIAQRIRNILV